ncbi:MAG: carbon monoxide dehydrogenase [Nitrospinae bacterium]|nr:carbon monoxide dehydrogenase [Nitrospinota bacterium]
MMGNTSCCCSAGPAREATSSIPTVTDTTSQISFQNRWDHFLARVGLDRYGHLVVPGLYRLGSPSQDSPVFVTANYTLSFDVLRSSLDGINAYILVLDTKGVNVWCAAGKGTFGTDELVDRVEKTHLKEIVNHRKLIVPQLGAVGVAAHIVKKRSGFSVEYGPVRASDIPDYMRIGAVTKEMRRVTFTLLERLAVAPVEVKNYMAPMAASVLVMYLAGGFSAAVAAMSAFIAGILLFPTLLPWLPSSNFSVKGFALGGAVAIPFAVFALFGDGGWIQNAGWAMFYMLAMPPVTAFLALNFTGSTTFTSVSGVKREIEDYTPIMKKSFGVGMAMMIATILLKWMA